MRLLLALALLTASAHAAAGFDRTLAVSSTPDVYVATGSGHIHVFPGPDTGIHVRAHVYSNWHFGSDVDQRIRRIEANPPIQQNGNQVRIGDTSAGDRGLFNNISIDYEIAAPQGSTLNLHSGSGDIEVDDVGRLLKADTGSGSLRAVGIAGQADLHTGSGDIYLEQRAKGEVRAITGSGSVQIRDFNGNLTARTGSGNIDASGNLVGPANLQSGSGSIHLNPGAGAHYSVDASSGSGSIRVAGQNEPHHSQVSREINGGGPHVEIRTGSGSITVD